MQVFGLTDKGIVRRDNQDHFQIATAADGAVTICVVCDGMGGAKAGNVASELAAETFTKTLTQQPMSLLDDTQVEAALCDAMMAANRVVYDAANEQLDYKGMGTTLVGAVLRADFAYFANVGDSRAYQIRDGEITQITRDHSLVEDMVMRGDITRDEAMVHPNRNLITRVVGTETTVSCDLFKLALEPGDQLLFCSDGLTNLVSSESILLELTNNKAIESATEMLVTQALAKGGTDNITVLVVRV